MTRAFLRVSLLFVLVARFAAPAAAFAHPRRSDVLGSGADTLVEDHRVLDETNDELAWTNENDKPYTYAVESSPDAWSRANHLRASKDVTTPNGRYPNSEARTRQRELPFGVVTGHQVVTHQRDPLGSVAAPRVTRVFPNSGPTAGGTSVEIFGAGFAWPATGKETCMFSGVFDADGHGGGGWMGGDTDTHAFAFAYPEVPAIGVSKTSVTCVTPPTAFAGPVAVQVAVDGTTYSVGSVFFAYTADAPAGYFTVDNATGSFGGGTVVTITLRRFAANRAEKTNYVYAPFRKSTHAKCLWSYDHVGAWDAVWNLSRVSTPQNASAIRENASGAFFGDCRPDCVLEKVSETHVPFIGNFSWSGYCPIDIVNVTALNLTKTEVIGKFGELWSPLDRPVVDFFGDADAFTNFSDTQTLRNCSFRPFIPVRTQTSAVEWIGYSKVQCKAPQQTMPPTNTTFGPNMTALNVTVALRISNDGLNFSDSDSAPFFSYVSPKPDLVNVFTKQLAGYFNARGPFSGNTELFLHGSGFVPGEQITARLSTYVMNATSNWNKNRTKETGRCFFDTPNQIRCNTPRWYPYQTYYDTHTGGDSPCFRTWVEVSNDFGLSWSGAQVPSRDMRDDLMFFYCPVYVSPNFGHNTYGRGTPMLPYRDVSRAIQAALVEPRAYWVKSGGVVSSKKTDSGPYDQTNEAEESGGRETRGNERGKRGRGLGEYVNHDQIVLTEGGYLDVPGGGLYGGKFGPERNLNLDPGGRVVEIVAETFAFFSGRGSESSVDVERHGGAVDKNEQDAEQQGVLYFNRDIASFVDGVVRWEAFETLGGSPGNGSDGNGSDVGAYGKYGYRRRTLLGDGGGGGGDGNGNGNSKQVFAKETERQTNPPDTDGDDDAGTQLETRRGETLGEVGRRNELLTKQADAANDAAVIDTPAARRRRYQGSRG